MCEFDIFLEEEKIFEDVIQLRRNEGGELLAYDILGRKKNFGNVEIAELNVPSEKLVLNRR